MCLSSYYRLLYSLLALTSLVACGSTDSVTEDAPDSFRKQEKYGLSSENKDKDDLTRKKEEILLAKAIDPNPYINEEECLEAHRIDKEGTPVANVISSNRHINEKEVLWAQIHRDQSPYINITNPPSCAEESLTKALSNYDYEKEVSLTIKIDSSEAEEEEAVLQFLAKIKTSNAGEISVSKVVFHKALLKTIQQHDLRYSAKIIKKLDGSIGSEAANEILYNLLRGFPHLHSEKKVNVFKSVQQKLLKWGASPDHKIKGRTLLMWAIDCDMSVSIVEPLVSNSQDIDIKSQAASHQRNTTWLEGHTALKKVIYKMCDYEKYTNEKLKTLYIKNAKQIITLLVNKGASNVYMTWRIEDKTLRNDVEKLLSTSRYKYYQGCSILNGS